MQFIEVAMSSKTPEEKREFLRLELRRKLAQLLDISGFDIETKWKKDGDTGEPCVKLSFTPNKEVGSKTRIRIIVGLTVIDKDRITGVFWPVSKQ